MTNQEAFEEHCSKRQKLCYLALLNGEHRKVQHNELLTKWEHQLEVLDRIKNVHGAKQASFVYVDASCHDELLLKFDISDDTLPNLIAYNSERNQYVLDAINRFSKLIGIFDYESINRFVDKNTRGQTNQIAVKDIRI